ncbi:VWA domain-containing protein [Mycetocola sp.]|jgi:Ca-activated chloride channel family protein|uniref:VWA domain-containing protein n=1 Tax=Mycetocola sp. TaxID=1871042 RepID=UPI002635AA0F|nr:VWA domain-containing protein [Mycetocola sp.]MCU1419859.1 Ca-activated chloride channel family protein [Mycetocola sp.]MCU1559184.1 Ca-activated chloride channel family protein [Mycetocola sp.]
MTFSPLLPVGMLVVVLGALALFAMVQYARAPRRHGSWHWLIRLGMVLLLFGLAMRPALPSNLQPPTASGDVDVYFVVDTTSSMAAEDYGPAGEPRLVGVRADIAEIASKLAGARFSLITFDAETVQRLPLTTDTSALVSGTEALNQEVTIYSAGSSISAPAGYLAERLAGDAEQYPDRTRVLFYLGDGEQTSSRAPESFEPVRTFIDEGAVLGYGTQTGGRMRQFNGYDDNDATRPYITWFSDAGVQDAVSKIDEVALQSIATQLGVDYQHRDVAEPIDPALAGITVGNVDARREPVVDTPEFYWIFAIGFGMLALTEAGALAVALRDLRRLGGGDSAA